MTRQLTMCTEYTLPTGSGWDSRPLMVRHEPDAGIGKTAVIFYSAFGVRFGIEMTSTLLRHMPPSLVANARIDNSLPAYPTFTLSELRLPSGDPCYQIGTVDGDVTVESTLEEALQSLTRSAEQFVAETARDYVFVHAGVVGWCGKAILIPGRTFSGKSTLTMALVAAGATYYSDEYAVLDHQGRIHSFARPPRLRQDTKAHFVETASSLPSVNSEPLSPLTIGLVLKTCYEAAGVWQPRQLTRGETLLALLEHTVAVRSQAELSVRALRNSLLSASGFKTARTEAEPAASKILQLLEECSDN